MTMKTCQYTLLFNSPAFLGNATQEAQWRTPPFKALLRQWWRVAYAAENGFKVDVSSMRHEEGLLFGHAWLGDDIQNGKKVAARKSAVRLRLDPPTPEQIAWDTGKQKGVAPLCTGIDTSYAWFGLIEHKKGSRERTGIEASRLDAQGMRVMRIMRLAAPEVDIPRLQEVMTLIDAFGLLGSRSRGGWGALHVPEAQTAVTAAWAKPYTRRLTDCLQFDWAMSLAQLENGKPAIWHSTDVFPSWDTAMSFIAAQRPVIRTCLKSVEGKDLRSALGFASPGRMPSPLRWKIVPAANNRGLQVRIFAMPHRIPDASGQHMPDHDLQLAWQAVFKTLRARDKLSCLDD